MSSLTRIARRHTLICLLVVVATALVVVGNAAPAARAHESSSAPAAASRVASRATEDVSSPSTLSRGRHTITYDRYSLMIDGKRTFIWGGEFQYFREPSPSLWLDSLQKMKAAGFNAVTLYFDWAYHSPAPGVYDFTGVRNVDKLLDDAAKVGLYVIARPGPYINAEVDGGGFPDWLGTEPGHERSTDPTYLAAADQWMSKINPIIARHQLTNGTGTVILDQIENEFFDGSPTGRAYMVNLEDEARNDGITVPLTGNHSGTFTTGAGALDIDGPDDYPLGFNCSNPTHWNQVPDLSGGHPANAPLYIPEFQGGSFDPWGGPGYAACARLVNDQFANVFYKQNIAIGSTMQSFYMTVGGTSWGWQAEPSQVYTSYDYGAPISETRQLTAKYQEDKLIGEMTQAVAPLAMTDRVGSTPPGNPAIVDTVRRNPDTGTQFHTLRHADSTSTSVDTTHISIDFNARAPDYTFDDTDPTLQYSGSWTPAAHESFTGGDFDDTETFSNVAGDSLTVPFTGTAVRWIGSKTNNHGLADVFIDGVLQDTVDDSGNANQAVLFAATGLTDGPHTLKIVVDGRHSAGSTDNFVSIDAIDLSVPKPATYPVVPQQPGTAITLDGRDSHIIVADYKMGESQLQYSTSEIMTNQTIAGRDVAVLYGDTGSDGETVLNYSSKPTVTVLAGKVTQTWDPTSGDLRLNYTHTGLQRVLITGGGVRPLLLLIGTTAQAERFWLQQTGAGPVLLYGSDLLRSASVNRGTLALTGDSSGEQKIEVFARPAHTITWNGHRESTVPTTSGSQLAVIGGPAPIHLPRLTKWKHRQGSPESQPGFDDSAWQVADKMTTNSITTPATLPVLFADDYGFHHGDVWYRGHFKGTAATTGITLDSITGTAGVYEAWLNGEFLGSSDDATHTFTFPAGALKVGADNEISVLLENSGHNEDFTSNSDNNKQARGLTGATIAGSPLTSITWRIQGDRGGETPIDAVRGAFNTGGLFGERAGWYLPGFPDDSWKSISLPTIDTTPGVSWYRTTFHLKLPSNQDSSIGLKISDDPSRAYQALIYVNGWQLGRYANNIGPQTDFPIPNGILNTQGTNTIAIAVVNEDDSTGGLGAVSLESFGSPVSPLKVAAVDSPGYDAARFAMPAPHQATLTADAPDTSTPDQTSTVTATFAVPRHGPAARDLAFGLQVPDGWTVSNPTGTVVHTVRSGTAVSASWTVTAPDAPATVAQLTATAHYTQRDRRQSLTDPRDVHALPTPPTSDVAVSGLPFFTATNGWGPVERNTSNGEMAPGDGHTITINGQTFASGLGTNSPSDVGVFLGGNCTRFTATVGLDDEEGNAGTVTFSVISDGKTLVTTPVLTNRSPAVTLNVDITGTQLLDLVVGEGGDGNGNDHADWANAQLTCS